MLANQRRSQILEDVRRPGAVRVSSLVESLGVSDMTVRRDLKLLAQEGFVVKVHGGALLPGGRSTEEPSTVPAPPVSRVPPSTTAAMASSFIPTPRTVTPEDVYDAIITPPKPASKPDITFVDAGADHNSPLSDMDHMGQVFCFERRATALHFGLAPGAGPRRRGPHAVAAPELSG